MTSFPDAATVDVPDPRLSSFTGAVATGGATIDGT
jgi:hypothetical protein